jgi:hypothetical protein
MTVAEVIANTKKQSVKKSEPGTSALADKAMLVRLTCHWWDPHFYHDGAAHDVETERKAKSGVSAVKVKLLGNEVTGPMWAVITKARKFNYTITLPWDDDGWRVLSSVAYQDYVVGINELKAEMEREKSAFKKQYAERIEADKIRLGTLYNPAVYPPIGEIDWRNGLEINVRPIPSGQHFMCDVGDAERDRIRKSIDQDAQDTIKRAVGDIWQRYSKVLTRMIEGLKAYQPSRDGARVQNAFRDSLVDNITDLLDVVPVLNVIGDPVITTFADEIRQKLTANSPEVLRDDAKIRKAVLVQAEDILAKMANYLN